VWLAPSGGEAVVRSSWSRNRACFAIDVLAIAPWGVGRRFPASRMTFVIAGANALASLLLVPCCGAGDVAYSYICVASSLHA
jgi:hypothetical protein